MSDFLISRDENGSIMGRRARTHESIMSALGDVDFQAQGTLDLHGLREAEAQQEIRAFVHEAFKRSARYILIIHGKGRHSAQAGGVLGDAAILELSRGPSQQWVEAFRTAPRHAGGTGALAVCVVTQSKKKTKR